MLAWLEWHRKPNLDAMRRAYIIKSRIRDISGLILVQPYSPAFFAQGVIPGPDLLLKRQRLQISPKELEKAWAKVTEEEEAEAALLNDWPKAMPLPCRWCSIKSGREVQKPLKAFLSDGASLTEVYDRCIKQGEDMTCLRCRQLHTTKVQANNSSMLCDGCQNVLPTSRSKLLRGDGKADSDCFPCPGIFPKLSCAGPDIHS